jgi:hypothetical protein
VCIYIYVINNAAVCVIINASVWAMMTRRRHGPLDSSLPQPGSTHRGQVGNNLHQDCSQGQLAITAFHHGLHVHRQCQPTEGVLQLMLPNHSSCTPMFIHPLTRGPKNCPMSTGTAGKRPCKGAKSPCYSARQRPWPNGSLLHITVCVLNVHFLSVVCVNINASTQAIGVCVLCALILTHAMPSSSKHHIKQTSCMRVVCVNINAGNAIIDSSFLFFLIFRL